MSKNLEPIGQAKELPIPKLKMCNQPQIILELPIEQFSPPEYYTRAGVGLDDYLAKSIEQYGQLVPILVNQHTDRQNVIIDGVARWEAMSTLGYKTIEVIFKDVIREQELQEHIISNIQCREFYKEFIEHLNGPVGDALLEYFASKDKTDVPAKQATAKPVMDSQNSDSEIRPLNIHLTAKDANWIKCMRKVLRKENQSQVFQFLIKYFIENEKYKTEQAL